MTQTIWNDERTAYLTKLIIEGEKSAAVIGDELTEKFKINFPRNSVIGKIFRLKMGKRKKPVIFHSNKHKGTTVNSNRKLQTPVNGTRYNISSKSSGFRHLMNVEVPSKSIMICIDQLDCPDESAGGRCNMCRYPSRNENGVTVYCGLPTGGKSSWCDFHRQITTVHR